MNVRADLRIASLVALTILGLSGRVADAGPYCGFGDGFAPAEGSTLPASPTIAYYVEHGYYDGDLQQRAKPRPFVARIDGKRVGFSIKQVRTDDGLIRLIRIKSKRTGKLEIWMRDSYTKETTVVTHYTIADDWARPATATATFERGVDDRLSAYRRTGHVGVLRVDVPAIAFELRWRPSGEQRWRAHTVPAQVNIDSSWDGISWVPGPHNGRSEAWFGGRMCGFVETVPVAQLEAGVEVQLTARLPDGTERAVDGIANPLVLPPK